MFTLLIIKEIDRDGFSKTAGTALTGSPSLIKHPLLGILSFILQMVSNILCNRGHDFHTYFRPFTINICQKHEIRLQWHRRSLPPGVLNNHCSNVNIFLSVEAK